MSGPTFSRFPDRRLCVEVQYTPDRRVDLPEGSWAEVPAAPGSRGWILWDANPDRKSGWLRVWRRGVGPALIVKQGGCA